ncbi:MAG TPA: FliH/SctL family protein [Oligoflexus sp.]|uniref:FliH/SctL family protein n=1 Tax=Oligoflexus sp. TaxID=1971216 RepID=UPI002D80CA5C|nr:FliH/SctL family protein [Oligoflexus sp.]HET9241087.1 FliH/SctL family protein [Oligoflexus sp.]
MLNQANNRSHGRFIKKDDPVRKVMNISEFNLMEICDKPVTYHDNANANIIHNRLHAEEELAEGVRDSYEINMSFPHELRPVIRPLDFTEEWKKQKKRMANRHHRLEEEEEFELDVTSLLKENKIDFKKATFRVIETAMPQQKKDVKEAKPAVNLFPQAMPVKANVEAKAAAPAPQPARPAAQKAPPPPAPEPTHHTQADADDFVPYAPTRDRANPEAQVQRMEPPKLTEEEKETLRNEARAEGYQQGFQQGEEKGTLSAQDKITAITDELANIMENLQGMQKSILTHVQENFLMICQSFLEALLHREFKVNPESFGAVIERAISDALPDDEFIIHVSPQAFQDLSNWSNPEMRRRLRVDDKLQNDHFRVEGKHSVIDGDLPKVIRDLLDQADIQLFESKEKAG